MCRVNPVRHRRLAGNVLWMHSRMSGGLLYRLSLGLNVYHLHWHPMAGAHWRWEARPVLWSPTADKPSSPEHGDTRDPLPPEENEDRNTRNVTGKRSRGRSIDAWKSVGFFFVLRHTSEVVSIKNGNLWFCRSPTSVQTEISQQWFDGLRWNLVDINELIHEWHWLWWSWLPL